MYPKILQIYGPLWIHGYGLMVAVGFFVFVYFLYKNSKRKEIISDETFFNTLFLGLFSGIIGSRLITVIYEWKSFSKDVFQIFYPWVGGFGMLGAILGVLLTISIYFRYKRIPFFEFFDVVAIYAPLIEGFARFGCLFAGCCYGLPAKDSIFYIIFSNPDGLAPLYIALYPTQIYSSMASFTVFLILYFRSKYFSYKNGELLFSFLLLSSFSRFFIDFLRGDRDYILNLDFSYSQLIAFSIFIFSVIGLIIVRKKQ